MQVGGTAASFLVFGVGGLGAVAPWPRSFLVSGGGGLGTLAPWPRSFLVSGGGGPPARSTHASLRLGVIDLEARPGLAAAPGH